MRIGVDIDGVLINDDDYVLGNGTKFCVENGLDFYLDPLKYEVRKFAFYYDKEVLKKYTLKYWWNYLENAIPRIYAKEVLNKLKDEGHKIYIITSRHYAPDDTKEGLKVRELTKDWLQKNGLIYDDIYFVHDKVEVIKNKKIDVIIEDSPKTIPKFLQVTKVLCYDTRYNVDLKGDNLIRVYSWYDIYDKIHFLNK